MKHALNILLVSGIKMFISTIYWLICLDFINNEKRLKKTLVILSLINIFEILLILGALSWRKKYYIMNNIFLIYLYLLILNIVICVLSNIYLKDIFINISAGYNIITIILIILYAKTGVYRYKSINLEIKHLALIINFNLIINIFVLLIDFYFNINLFVFGIIGALNIGFFGLSIWVDLKLLIKIFCYTQIIANLIVCFIIYFILLNYYLYIISSINIIFHSIILIYNKFKYYSTSIPNPINNV